jgi:hypothetical protein
MTTRIFLGGMSFGHFSTKKKVGMFLDFFFPSINLTNFSIKFFVQYFNITKKKKKW